MNRQLVPTCVVNEHSFKNIFQINLRARLMIKIKSEKFLGLCLNFLKSSKKEKVVNMTQKILKSFFFYHVFALGQLKIGQF